MEAHPLRFFDDDGTEITPDLIPKPGLCLSCAKEDDPSEVPFCILTRFDQKDEDGFCCFAYVPKTGEARV